VCVGEARLRRDPSEACAKGVAWTGSAGSFGEGASEDARLRAIRTSDTFNFRGQASINEALIRELNVGGE